MRDEWTIKIIDVGYRFTRDVFIFRRTLGGAEFIQNDGTAFFLAEGSAEQPKPAIQLNPEALQALADELARTGYKPQKGFIEGKLDATEKHLDDMRKLVFAEKVAPLTIAPLTSSPTDDSILKSDGV